MIARDTISLILAAERKILEESKSYQMPADLEEHTVLIEAIYEMLNSF